MNARKRERTGFRLTHAQYTDADGAVRTCPKWVAEFRDALERKRKLTLFTSRAESESAARLLVRLVENVQASGRANNPEILRGVALLPERVRRRLAGFGLLEPERATVAALDELLGRWAGALRARGTTEKQARTQRLRAAKLIRLAGFKRLADVDRGQVEAVLAKLRAGEIEGERRLSARTSNGTLQALGSFCRWAVRERLLAENPLAEAARVTVTDERERDALDLDEQARLLDATEAGPERDGLDGRTRATLYRLALTTGLRAGELANLKRSALDLDADPPTLTLAPKATKNRRGCTLPLVRELLPELREAVRGKLPETRVFATLGRIDELADTFRADLAAARATWLDEAATPAEREARQRTDFLLAERHNGRVLVFHSLRHSFIANGKRAGIPLATMMQLARHSDPKLTAKRYGALALHDLSAAVAALPSPRTPGREAASRTGTDDAAPLPSISSGKAAPLSANAPGGVSGRGKAPEGEHSSCASATPAAVHAPESASGNLVSHLVFSGTRGQTPVDFGRQSHRISDSAKTPEKPVKIALRSGKTEQPPAGLEPATCGLQNRCSAN